MTLFGVSSADLASYVTAGATLVLAFATFAAVRSGSRSARIAEVALQEQRRPVLAPSRLDDPAQKIMFLERHWVTAPGGRAAVEHDDGVVYLAISLRNVGSGIAVCQGWAVSPEVVMGRGSGLSHLPLDSFHLQSRDLYVPAGDIGMWQGALRNPEDPVRTGVVDAIEANEPITVELLYSDQVGQQRTISRFALFPAGDHWIASMSRHWFLDWDGPRPEELNVAAAEAIARDHEAVQSRRDAQSRALEVEPEGT
ncbi:MAG: hypothetical protein JO368_13320 [Acidimicrobiales bacterium]|nr:hypothetical protein [Acidimicrobiales bacterium]